MGLLVNHLLLSPQQTVGDRVAEFPYTNAAKRLLHKTSDQAAKIKQMTIIIFLTRHGKGTRMSKAGLKPILAACQNIHLHAYMIFSGKPLEYL